jgi:hypothetical protein
MGIYSVAVSIQLSAVSLLACGPDLLPRTVHAQVIGEHAEMERLHHKAEEAMANADPDGASMNSGKAALMAAHLAKREGNSPTGDWYRGAEALFRSQEHGYRALALFQRAGAEPPASTGVCQSVQLAAQQSQHAREWLGTRQPLSADAKDSTAPPTLAAVAEDWHRTLDDLRKDFQCP